MKIGRFFIFLSAMMHLILNSTHRNHSEVALGVGIGGSEEAVLGDLGEMIHFLKLWDRVSTVCPLKLRVADWEFARAAW